MTTTEPAWLTAKVDQRLALMADMIWQPDVLTGYVAVVTTLTEPAEGCGPHEYAQWDKSCDNCGKYCPATGLDGTVRRELMGVTVEVAYRMCRQCGGAA